LPAPLESFDFAPRTRLIFGPGTLARLGSLARELGARKALVVTDPGIVSAGHAGRAIGSLEAAGVEVAVFAGVEENPTTRHVEAGVSAAREAAIDFLVGVGGGSAMDCAKGINFILSSGGEMKDYWGVGKARGPMLPMIAVPTTAGTGSESQSFALISDPVTHQKMACGDQRAACRAAILDPELTLTQPPAVTAATGIDAISHAVESYVTRARTPISRMLSREAWRLLAASFTRVIAAPDDLEARGRMLLGASLAGAAIENSMLGAAHAAANPLTAHHGVIHGHAIGILLPHVVRWNAEVAGSDYRDLVLLAGGKAGSAPGEDLARLIADLHAPTGLPRRLGHVPLDGAPLDDLATEAAAPWTAQFNPRPIGAEGFLEIYECAR
jgi:alcohol dehydrogenase